MTPDQAEPETAARAALSGDDRRPIVVWFRRDLRLDDHRPLAAAVRIGRPIVPLVVLDPALLRGPAAASRRSARYLGDVRSLDRALRVIGGHLVVRSGDPTIEVPRVAAESDAAGVVAGRDPAPYAVRRDARVGRAVRLELLPGLLLTEPESLGEHRVFAAFHRRWVKVPPGRPIPAPERVEVPSGIRGEELDRGDAALSEAGEQAAHGRLDRFIASGLARYDEDRSRLDIEGTSGLSIDLHHGSLSARRVADAVSAASAAGAVPEGAATAFLRQLAWRDWAAHRLWFESSAGGGAHDWDASVDAEPAWRDDPGALAAWKAGRTGYPVVDAAMRQLGTTGWIHNRARMIVASFLTKDLLLDWRLGAHHFLHELLDGDVANNTLGWRWTSGLGADAAPFVRVFNPSLQGERFDRHGTWLRRWVPELEGLPDETVHRPWEAPGGPPNGYPAPIVDHAAARERALAAFHTRQRTTAGSD